MDIRDNLYKLIKDINDWNTIKNIYDEENSKCFILEFKTFSDRQFSLSDLLYCVCRKGNIELVNKFITTMKKDYYWWYGLEGACEGGDLQIINKMLVYNKKHIHPGLFGACRGGHIEIAKYMINMGAKNFNQGLCYACHNSHINLINLMIEKGATDLNEALFGACKGGNMNIVQMIINIGATDFNNGLNGACEGGHIEIAKYMIKMGANNLDKALEWACEYNNNIEIADYIINLGACNLTTAIETALFCDNLDLTKYLIKKAKSKIDCKIDYKIVFDSKCGSENNEHFDEFGVDMNKEYNELVLIFLLENGVERDELVEIPCSTRIFDKLDLRNTHIKETLDEIIVPDVAKVISSYYHV